MESSEKLGDEKRECLSSPPPQGSIIEAAAEAEAEAAEMNKCCSICKTTKTPLWRSGPSGPKTLCNACGIRYRNKRPTPKGKSTIGSGRGRDLKARERLRPMMAAKEEAAGQGSSATRLRRSRAPAQWGEVERAALLLMALSYGCGTLTAN
ncbi:GATA transcription factor 23-like isoform X2 [Andrographis paniculata]|uniref:GATA transcription factor 23-like isoform X2 n=1 Tax=Andrographis paniculata TaxID=175694 RepID=UPI0021E989F7|nr:GATA transcription factor 23-like isoform X2 [Andrographis paniculata]